MANANAATFDGAADYLTRGADLTGNADSQQVTFSFWVKRAATGARQKIYAASGNDNFLEFQADDTVRLDCENGAGTTILNIESSAITDTANWHHIIGSFDLSDVAKRHLYVDDTTDLTVTTYTNDTINFLKSDHAIGALANGTFLLNACLAEVWIDFGTYINLGVETNRRLFYSVGGGAVDLGADGSTPTGAAPLIYLANAFDSFQTNLGSGGGFTENGALTDCVGPELSSGGVGLSPALFGTTQRRSTLLRM